MDIRTIITFVLIALFLIVYSIGYFYGYKNGKYKERIKWLEKKDKL